MLASLSRGESLQAPSSKLKAMGKQVRAHLTVEIAVGVRLALALLSRGADLPAPSPWLKAMRARAFILYNYYF